MRFILTLLALLLAGAAVAEDSTLAPTAPAAEEGFVSLFNGVDLTGWTGDTRNYVAEDGVLAGKPAGKILGNLYTEAEYADFILRFEFKLAPATNNGIGIRVPLKHRASTDGMEIQILDDSAPEHADVKPYQVHGSIYGIVPAEKGHLKPVGEWNDEEIRVEGTTVKVTLNGAVIVDADLKPFRDGAPTPDGKEHPGLKQTKGHLSFAGHTTPVYFRNLRIKTL